jgi:hypothetical protein
MKTLKKLLSNLKRSLLLPFSSFDAAIDIRDLLISQQTLHLQNSHPNPMNKFGKKYFSQSDEDGILLEIIKRLDIKNGFYIEFGVGNGLENNTLILAAHGWSGVWIGGEDLAFNLSFNSKLLYIKTWITLQNIIVSINKGLSFFNNKNIDLISIDLDGNDFYFVEKILENKISPRIFILEYNGAFPPPVEFKIDYDSDHKWANDNYFGASLMSYSKLLSKFGYSLICCNSHTGANAFFVRNEYKKLFPEVPKDIRDIYVSPRYYLYKKYGHKMSAKVIEKLFQE